MAGAILGAIFVSPRRTPRLIGVGLAAAVLGGLPMIESYRLANHSFAFMQALAGPDSMWSTKMRVGRFLYKSVYLFGPIATLLLGFAMFRQYRGGSRKNAWAKAPSGSDCCIGEVETSPSHRRASAIPVFLGIIAANAILFLRYPIEISYLIPTAFFLLLLVGMEIQRKSFAVATLLAILSLNFVTPQFAQPNIPGHATGASFRPSLEPGILIEDIRLRLTVRQCEDYRCYFLVFHPGSHGMDYSGPLPLRAPLK